MVFLTCSAQPYQPKWGGKGSSGNQAKLAPPGQVKPKKLTSSREPHQLALPVFICDNPVP